MFGRKKVREGMETPDEYDLRKRVYMKISEEKKITKDHLIQEIETEYIHKDEIEKKLNFLIEEGFVRKESENGLDYYQAVE